MALQESNLRENLSSVHQICKKDEFPFQVFGSKGNNNYLQEFHHLDPFHPIDSSSNPVIEGETLHNFDHFNIPYYSSHDDHRSSSKSNKIGVEDYLYEFNKGYADQNGGCGQVMDNFRSYGDYCNSFLQQRNNQFVEIMGMERNSIIPLNFSEVKPVNFIVPDEVSCISTSGNAQIQKESMNKNVTFSSLLRTARGRKKANVIKGQWTVEEDR